MAKPSMMGARWELYRRIVLPPDAPSIQIDECRKAFIAGAVEVYRFLMDAGTLAAGDEPTDEDMETMRAFNDELNALAENEIRKMFGGQSQ